jgi:CheY-like chemotaxis protein
MKRTVLMIEDNAQNSYLARYLLEHEGYAVIVAQDGPTWIALARSLRPDLIVLDVQLPGLDGYAVVRELRGIEALRRTPIVAVTSFAMVGDRERALAAGFDGYLEKPIDPDTFVRDVERVVVGSARPDDPS